MVVRRARSPLREWLDSHRWTDTHRRLSQHPLFASCTRPEIRWIRRWGDEVSINPGETLLREDSIGYHFVVVLSGHLDVTRHGRHVDTIGPGGHVGDGAILSFGPQPTTVTSKSPCRLFVLGRRFLLSLAVDTPGFRNGIFPGLDRAEATARVRVMREEGRAAYRELAAAHPELFTEHAPEPSLLHWNPSRRPVDDEFSSLLDATRAVSPARLALPRVGRGLRALGYAASATAAAALSFAWHPPVLVVTPGTPIDLGAEVHVADVGAPPVHGHFILVSVHLDEPALAGLLLARARGDATLRAATDQDAARRAGRRAFADSQGAAIKSAALAIGRDPAALRVSFAAHEIGGPSASLAYALTLVDLVDAGDLARGRTIAATGQLDTAGRVYPVGYIKQKAAVARAAGATLMLVPHGQAAGIRGIRVVEVATLQEAITALRAR